MSHLNQICTEPCLAKQSNIHMHKPLVHKVTWPERRVCIGHIPPWCREPVEQYHCLPRRGKVNTNNSGIWVKIVFTHPRMETHSCMKFCRAWQRWMDFTRHKGSLVFDVGSSESASSNLLLSAVIMLGFGLSGKLHWGSRIWAALIPLRSCMFIMFSVYWIKKNKKYSPSRDFNQKICWKKCSILTCFTESIHLAHSALLGFWYLPPQLFLVDWERKHRIKLYFWNALAFLWRKHTIH